MQQIVDGVVFNIKKEFGGDYRIYTETVEQGLKEPCFIVTVKETKMEHRRGDRHSFSVRFQITYFPKNEEARSECYAVCGRLYPVLGAIPVGESLVRGSGRSFVVDDNLLHFFVQYDYQFFHDERNELERSELMGSLEMNFE